MGRSIMVKGTRDQWPTSKIINDGSAQLKEKAGLSPIISTDHQLQIWDLIRLFSSINKMLRITALCFRVVNVLKEIFHYLWINPDDLHYSKLFWVRASQVTHFSSEIRDIWTGSKLSKSHPLTKLTAFIDNGTILKVGGRLENSNLELDETHPIILPKSSTLTQLSIADTHQRTFYGGTQLTPSTIRNSYLTIGGRSPVRSHILKCVTSARQRGMRAQQLMGQLPASRAKP